MKKILRLTFLLICFGLLAHNSACTGFLHGALEEANRQMMEKKEE